MRWLVSEGTFVQEVAEDAKGEDCDGEDVAAIFWVSAGQFSDGFVVIFLSRCNVPEDWVECNGSCCNCEALLVEINQAAWSFGVEKRHCEFGAEVKRAWK